MKKNKLIISIALSLVLLAFIILVISDNETYGNDKESILKIISSLDRYQNTTIDLLGMHDIQNHIIVGFLADEKPAYISFHKDENDNYKWDITESDNNGNTEICFIKALHGNDEYDLVTLVITNQYSDASEFRLDANGQLIELDLEPREKSLEFIKIPLSSNGEYTFDYMFYDINRHELD